MFLQMAVVMDNCCRTGIYPLTAYPSSLFPPPVTRTRPASPEGEEQVKTESPEPGDVECRHIVNMQCQLDHADSAAATMHVSNILYTCVSELCLVRLRNEWLNCVTCSDDHHAAPE